jgi:large subunit ribosomal protein L6
MSRIGKQPVIVSADVEVVLSKDVIVVSGKLGKLTHSIDNSIIVEYNKAENLVMVSPKGDDRKSRSMWGLSRTLINNMVIGVSKGFNKTLEIKGVGYKTAVNGKVLTMFLGYSHDINYIIPEGIEIKCPKPTQVEIFGHDKQQVGEVAALIRSLRKPEPYKGKGVRYSDEVIIRKVGKKK